MTLYLGGKKLASLFYQGKRITTLWYKDKKIYSAYVKDGTLLWDGTKSNDVADPLSITLLFPLGRVKTELQFELPYASYNNAGGGTSNGSFAQGSVYNDGGTYTLPVSKLVTNQWVTVGDFTGGGSIWFSGEDNVGSNVPVVDGSLSVMKIDDTHIKIQRGTWWTATDIISGAHTGDTFSTIAYPPITSIKAY